MEDVQYKMSSIVGMIYLVASAQGLQGLFFNKQKIKSLETLDPCEPAQKILLGTIQQLEDYFSGQRKSFNVVLNFIGTNFQKRVWRELTKIPFGQTVSYRDIAQKIKSPKAFRAVGTANSKNPFCIIVPCHRVIAADGSLGGYSGGLSRKRRLLKIEKMFSAI